MWSRSIEEADYDRHPSIHETTFLVVLLSGRSVTLCFSQQRRLWLGFDCHAIEALNYCEGVYCEFSSWSLTRITTIGRLTIFDRPHSIANDLQANGNGRDHLHLTGISLGDWLELKQIRGRHQQRNSKAAKQSATYNNNRAEKCFPQYFYLGPQIEIPLEICYSFSASVPPGKYMRVYALDTTNKINLSLFLLCWWQLLDDMTWPLMTFSKGNAQKCKCASIYPAIHPSISFFSLPLSSAKQWLMINQIEVVQRRAARVYLCLKLIFPSRCSLPGSNLWCAAQSLNQSVISVTRVIQRADWRCWKCPLGILLIRSYLERAKEENSELI